MTSEILIKTALVGKKKLFHLGNGHLRGLYIGKYPPSPGELSANMILQEKYEKAKRIREKCKRKRKKGEENEKSGSKRVK